MKRFGPVVGASAMRPHSVVLVGPQAAGNLVATVRAAAARGCSLTVVSVGFPPTDRQRQTVESAVAEAIRVRLPFEAVLAVRAEDIAGYLRPTDEVVPMASCDLLGGASPAGRAAGEAAGEAAGDGGGRAAE
jgi:hypothetical protein